MAAKEPRTIVKRVPHAILYSDGTIRVDHVRASYPHLFEPYKGKDDKGTAAYSITGLLPKKTHTAAKDLLKEQMFLVMKEGSKGKVKDLPDDKKFLRNGDKAAKDGYEGMFTISCRESKRPSVRDRNKRPVSKDEADMFYGGCWVTILLRPWYQDNDYGKRVNANLIAVQFVRDDDSFGEGRIDEDTIDETFDDQDDGEETGGFDDEDDMGGL